jgi:hypothetical protein
MANGAPPDVTATVLGIALPRDGRCEVTVQFVCSPALGRQLLEAGNAAHQGLTRLIAEQLGVSDATAGWKGARAHLAALAAERDRLRQEEQRLEGELRSKIDQEQLNASLDRAAHGLDRVRRKIALFDDAVGVAGRETDEAARFLAAHARSLAEQERQRVLREIDGGELDTAGILAAARDLVSRLVPLRGLRGALGGWGWSDGLAGRLAVEILGAPPPPEPPLPPPPPPPVRHPFAPPGEDVELTVINPVTREGVR